MNIKKLLHIEHCESEDIVNHIVLEFINRRMRQVLMHSIIYYRMNENILPDNQWDLWARQLDFAHKQFPKVYKKAELYECFKNFDPASGYYLEEMYNTRWTHKAQMLLDNYKSKHERQNGGTSMKDDIFHVFVYGSFMSEEFVKLGCEKCKEIGKAFLKDKLLVYKGRFLGVDTLCKEEGSKVYGVVFKVKAKSPENFIRNLHEAYMYKAVNVKAITEDGEIIKAVTFIAHETEEYMFPYTMPRSDMINKSKELLIKYGYKPSKLIISLDTTWRRQYGIG